MMFVGMAYYFSGCVKNVIQTYNIERHWVSLNDENRANGDSAIICSLSSVLETCFKLSSELIIPLTWAQGNLKQLTLAHLFGTSSCMGLLAVQVCLFAPEQLDATVRKPSLLLPPDTTTARKGKQQSSARQQHRTTKSLQHKDLTPDQEATMLIEGASLEYLLFCLPPWKLVGEAQGRPSGAAPGHPNGKTPDLSLIFGDP
jgi:hypothetical protein